MLKKGLMQIYTGNGKGKTTAAFGLALRAAGNNLKVFIGQFAKGCSYGEIKAVKKLKNITVEQFGRSCFIKGKPRREDIKKAERGLKRIEKVLTEKKYDVVILDEINIAIHLKLLKTKDVISAIKNAPKNIEIVLTGRKAPGELIRMADLVSEIKEIKHYYNKGVKARKGIEF